MKKLTLVLLVCLALVFAVVGCKQDATPKQSSSTQTSTSLQPSASDQTGTSQSASDSQSAQPEPAKYTLTLGETVLEVTYGQPIGELPAVPEQTGYTAAGWAIGDVAITEQTVWDYDENKIAQATYNANTYKLTFGETDLTVTYDQAIGTLPAAPAVDGYTANGWTIGETAITAETVWTYTEDKTAQATYNANTYKLTFGETEVTVTYDQAIGTLPAVPAQDGYTATGWQIGETAITAETVWTYTEDKTAQATYNANTYKLTFGETEVTVTYDQVIGTLPAVPAQDGYTATGWTIGETAITAETVWTYTEDKTATASYSANTYKLTLGETDLTVTYDQAIGELPAMPANTADKLYKGVWQIGETAITAETVWTYTEDMTATAPYRTLHDYSAAFTADFFKTSDDDYTFAGAAFVGLSVRDLIGVYHNGTPLEYTVNEDNFVFLNAYVKAMPVGDYLIDAYTENDAYRIKIAVATMAVTSVADLQAVANSCQADRDANPGYYIIANDIDGTDQGAVKALSYNSATPDNYTTCGFRGILDGRGHVIKNLKLAEGKLFWGIGNNGVVRDLALIDPVQVSASGYIFARDLVHATISNVLVKAGTERVFLNIACGAIIENCVFILDANGTNLLALKDDSFPESEHAPSTIKNVALSVKSNSGTLTGLFETYYKVEGTYEEYEAANGIHDYASSSAMFAVLASENYIAGWNSPFISFADNKLSFNGEVVASLEVVVTGNNEVYANSSVTLTAADATFALKEEITGVSIDAATGELTVGDVEIGTEIVVVATSTLVPSVSAEYTVTVVVKPVDLTAKVYDVELGSAHGITDIPDDILYIKTAKGTKIEIANANIVTADELNAAAGVKWSENMAITFYSESKAYTLNAAFITKIIDNYDEFKSVASGAATLDGYYVIANSFEANNETPMASWTAYSSTTTTGFVGVLDGRNHVISNLKVNDYILNGIGACTIKDIAFVNVTAANPSGGGKFLFNESHGMTMKNVFVSSSTVGTMCGFTGNAPNFENVVYVTTNLSGSQNYGLTWTGNPGTMTLKNVISVTPYSKGYYWGGTVSVENLAVYASQSAMMTALDETTFDSWNSPFTFADGKLSFGGTVVLQ